ncbi:MAG TPA: hypothetical protein VF699_00620 [Caulobacteraceae bacterium]
MEFELELAADEEIERALDLSWREVSRCIPWGDTYEGFTPGGRSAQFERSYIWAEGAGGDILCEVAVYEDPSRFEQAARRRRIIPKTTI